MELTRKNLVLTFSTVEGGKLNFTITKPKNTLDGSTIKQSMENIIAAGALGVGAEGRVTKILGAKYVIQQEDKLDLA